MPDSPRTAAIYVRISDDREGSGLGVARQEADCRALATRLGWTVAGIYSDNDLSAYSGKPRPSYRRMLTDIAAGRVDAIVAWHTDRLHRHPRELEAFIDLLDAHRVPVHTVKAGEVDLSTSSGRAVARTLGVWDRYESEHKSERILRKVEELADAGKIGNGGCRPFGYKRIYLGEGPRRKILRDELDPVEAPIVRDCARRALAGDTLRSIVTWLNHELKVPTSTGRPWSMQGLRLMLMSGRIAGLREHKRQVVGKAVWPAIITVDDHERLRALLAARTQPASHWVRKFYLSGFVFCSDCELRMLTGMRTDGQRRYSCPPKAEGGCGGRVIQMQGLETMVGRYLVRRSEDPQTLWELARVESDTDARARVVADRIGADERRLKLLEAALQQGDEEDLPEVLATVRTVRRRLNASREELARLVGVPAEVSEILPELGKRWPGLPMLRKRLVLSTFVDRILIGPAVRGRGFFDPKRVDIQPRKIG